MIVVIIINVSVINTARCLKVQLNYMRCFNSVSRVAINTTISYFKA